MFNILDIQQTDCTACLSHPCSEEFFDRGKFQSSFRRGKAKNQQVGCIKLGFALQQSRQMSPNIFQSVTIPTTVVSQLKEGTGAHFFTDMLCHIYRKYWQVSAYIYIVKWRELLLFFLYPSALTLVVPAQAFVSVLFLLSSKIQCLHKNR